MIFLWRKFNYFFSKSYIVDAYLCVATAEFSAAMSLLKGILKTSCAVIVAAQGSIINANKKKIFNIISLKKLPIQILIHIWVY